MRVLVIDNRAKVVEKLVALISSHKAPNGSYYTVVGKTDYEEALKTIDEEMFDIVVTDMRMGESETEGLEILKHLANKSAVTIVLTAYPSIPNCIESIKKGAWDYIEKAPADGSDPYGRLLDSLQKACEYRSKHPERGKRNPDSEWVHKHFEELVEKYPGQLVAVLYEKVVDSDTRFTELSKRLLAKFPLIKPTIVSMPEIHRGDI